MNSNVIQSYCRYHRQQVAGWSCEQCRAKLCVDCVAEKVIDQLRVNVCATCGHQVARIVVHRADTLSYTDRLRLIWRYPFCLGGIVGMGAVGALFAIGSIGLPYLGLAFAIFWGFVFVVIQSSARGEDDIGPPDFSSLWDSILHVLFRAFVATGASWVPLIFYLWSIKPRFFDALVDPIIWLLVVFGLVYAPMGFMAAAVRTPMLKLLNPLWMVRCVALLGREYWIAVGVLGCLGVLQFVLAWIATWIVRIPIPFVMVAIAAAMLTYVPLLMGRVLGLLIFVRGDKLGYGDENDYFEPVVRDRPRGSLPQAEKPALDLGYRAQPVEDVRQIEVDF